MKFELFVALRYLKAKRKQTMVSVISVISVIGIAAGVMALVIALALSTGFREDIQAKIVGATSYINLQRIDGTAFVNYDDLIAQLSRLPHVTGAAPAIFCQVYVLSPAHNQGAMLKGVDPALERHISDFFSHIVEGDPRALDAPAMPAPANPEVPPPPGNAIIGKEMARALGVQIGDTLRVVFPRGSLTPLTGINFSIGSKPFRVAAIFESGLWDFDANWLYTDLHTARRLLSLPAASATVLQFKTDDVESVQSVAQDIRAAAGTGVFTSTWIDLNKPLFSALKLEKIVLFVTIGLIVFVAALNIVTTLIMMVLEKQRDIAVLTAMGATQKTIMWVFMLQGSITGLIGTTAGAVLGVVVSRVLDAYKVIRLQAEVYSIPYVPFHVKFWDVALVCGTALAISFLATLYPARSASRLDPVEVLRHE
jgi:lipoprotein-releasing system permease protein